MMPPSLTMQILWAHIFLSEFLLGLHVFWNLSYQNFWVWSSASNLHNYNGKDCGCWVPFNDCRRAEMHVPRHWPLHWTTWMNGSVQVTSRHIYNCNRASIRSCKPVIDVYVAARMSMIDSSAASADEAQVAICDATNSTNERRDFLVCSCNFKDMRRLYPLNYCWIHVKVAKPGCDSRFFLAAEGKDTWAVAIYFHWESHYRWRNFGAELQIQDDVQPWLQKSKPWEGRLLAA